MRQVDRRAVPVPDSLAHDQPGRRSQSAGARELARNKTLAAGQKMSFRAYAADDVKAALQALFHGKCAYCESAYAATAPVDVEHFRPKGRVAEAAKHPGYWWLAADWDNLLPSCIDCNRRRRQPLMDATPPGAAETSPVPAAAGKADSFPVDDEARRAWKAGDDIGAEPALLIDPCRDRPDRHLGFWVAPEPLLALALPLDPPDAPQRGAAAITVHGLNRLALVQERTRLLRRMELMRDVLARLDEAAALIVASGDTRAARALAPIETAIDRLLDELRAMAGPAEPYSAMVAAWLAHWAAELAGDDD